MHARQVLIVLGLLAAAAMVMAMLVWPRPDRTTATGGNSITSPDTGGNVGYWSSLALDSTGNPVVSYVGGGGGELSVLHCNDPNCSGGDETITSHDSVEEFQAYISLTLDQGDNPVVSYVGGGGGRTERPALQRPQLLRR